MTQVINAFHPDYVKTYHPDLLESIRTQGRQKQVSQSVTSFVEEKRKTSPSHGTVVGVTKTPSHVHRSPKPIKVPILTKTQQNMTMKEVTDELIHNLKQKVKRK